jgi:hypothetical protein
MTMVLKVFLLIMVINVRDQAEHYDSPAGTIDSLNEDSDERHTTIEDLRTPRGVIGHESTLVKHDSSSLVTKVADFRRP